MVEIIKALIEDWSTIRKIAHQTWPSTYGGILSEIQLEYMLTKFYSDQALIENISKGHQFILVKNDDNYFGFASYEHNYLQKQCTRIHKIYILPETQSRGFGKLLLQFIEKSAIENHSFIISLNVNRFNSALKFYQKMDFKIVGDKDIKIGNGYLMEDFIMEKWL